jgi:hypothetical protein
VQLAVSKLGDFFSGSDFDPTEDRQDAQGAGTVLGSIDAKSDSIAKATEITASTNEELVNINTGMLQALKSVNAGILGASAMIARAQGNVNFQTQNEFSQQQQAGQAATALTGGTIGGLFGAGAGLVLGTAAGVATLGAVGAIVGFGVGALIAPIALLLDDLLGGIVSSAVGFLDNLTGGLLSSIGSSVFGGDQKIVDEGINIVGGQITDLINDVMVRSFAEIKTDGGYFGSDDYDTKFAALPDEIRNQFSLVFEGIVNSVSAGAAAIGLLPADIQSALNQFRVESQLISLEGLNAGEQTAAIQEVFGTIFDNLATSVVPFLDDFQRAGEGLGQTLARVATQVQLTEEAALSLGLALNTSVGPEQIARISGSLVDLVGGVEAFASAITSFESNFFSESEQFDVNARRLTQALGDLPLADTRQGFVDLLQAQDVTTASGREAIATLLRLQSSADEYYTALEDGADAALSALRASVDAEISAIRAQRQALESSLTSSQSSTDQVLNSLETLAGAEKQAAQDRLDITTAAINEENNVRLSANKIALDAAKNGLSAIAEEAGLLKSAFDSLTDAVIPQSVQFEQAIERLRNALRTGDLEGAGVAATEAAGVSSEGFATRADFAVAQGQAAFLVSQLNDQAQGQLSTAEQTIQRLEAQTDVIRTSSDAQIESANLIYENEVLRLDGILESARSQIEIQRGTNETLLSVDTAIAALEISLLAESAAQKELDAFTGQQQIESLNLIYDNALSQLNALLGIDSSVMGVQQALGAFNAALNRRAPTPTPTPTPEPTVVDDGRLYGLAGLYQELLGRGVDESGARFYGDRLASGAMTLDDVRSDMLGSDEYRSRVPGFAGGGMHSGGLRIVGERGPELEATGSSKIMSNSELMSSLGGNQKLADEMKSMHSDMMQGLNVIAKNTNKGSRQLERWDLTGLPAAREFV